MLRDVSLGSTVQSLSGAALVTLLTACGSHASDQAASASAATAASAKAGKVLEADENVSQAVTESTAKAAAESTIPIPDGSFDLGSTPGDRGRDPSLEPALSPTSLGAFDIDRSLYPNELGKPPLLGVTRDKAESLCKERGRRVCTEVEWERACKGPDGQAYAGNAAWDPKCAKEPESCASGFGVVGMGARREWTASEIDGKSESGAVLRGGAPDAAAQDHRCARRVGVDPGSAGDDVGFRCCGGAPNAVTIPKIVGGANFGPLELKADALSEIFGVVPELSKLGKDLKYFDPETSPKRVVERADGGTTKGYELTTAPVAWSPVPGESLIVVAGLAGDDSFIVAMYRLPGDRYRIASSLVLKKDAGPVVLAYDRSVDKRLEWSTCWQCPGESGRITYRDDGRVVITQE